mgnify:CR=1 FL=1
MDLKVLQKEIRLKSAIIINRAKSSHIGGVFSSADILTILYGEILNKNKEEFIDSFILSKGHCCAGVYSALNSIGFISNDLLNTYGQNGSPLMAHISHKVNTVEFSTGSLGHGLPFAVGKAIATKDKKKKTYVLLSDGEMDEGSNWEAIHFAGFQKLSNLTAIIDYNKYQSLASTYETLDLEPFVDKIESFNWKCIRCNGHDLNELKNAFSEDSDSLPKMIICDTHKGYPIDFMLNKVIWHYKPPSSKELDDIKQQLNEFYK